jgi:hypothetical protein
MTATTKTTRAATLLRAQQTNSTGAGGPLSEIGGGGKVIHFSRRAFAPRRKPALGTWDKNDESNVIRFTRLKSSHSGLQRTAAAAKAQTKAIEARVTEEGDNYRYQMLVNGLVAAFVGMLVMSGQWMFTILTNIR